MYLFNRSAHSARPGRECRGILNILKFVKKKFWAQGRGVKNLHFVPFWAPGPIGNDSSCNFRSNGPGPIWFREFSCDFGPKQGSTSSQHIRRFFTCAEITREPKVVYPTFCIESRVILIKRRVHHIRFLGDVFGYRMVALQDRITYFLVDSGYFHCSID